MGFVAQTKGVESNQVITSMVWFYYGTQTAVRNVFNTKPFAILWSLSTFYLGYLLLYFVAPFKINVVSVNIVKVIIFVNSTKQKNLKYLKIRSLICLST